MKDPRDMMWHEGILTDINEGNEVYSFLGAAKRVFAVKSDTDEMGFYYVMDFEGPFGRRICTCEGFRYSDHCKHTGRVPEL